MIKCSSFVKMAKEKQNANPTIYTVASKDVRLENVDDIVDEEEFEQIDSQEVFDLIRYLQLQLRI